MAKLLRFPSKTAPAEPRRIEAFASNPDGKGAVVFFVSFHNPDGSLTIANVALRLTEDLRNGFSEERSDRADLESTMRELTSGGGIELTPAPPGEVAELVAEAVARAQAMGSAIPRAMRRAVELIERVPRTPSPPLEPGRSLSMEGIVALLERPLYEAWFFDDEDLARLRVPRNPAGPVGTWMPAAMAALGRSPIGERMIAMARYMSRWWSWRGNADEAARWTTLAEGAVRSFAECPLAMAMFLKTILGPKMKQVAQKLNAPGGGPQGLVDFAELFPDVAARETRTIALGPQAGADAYLLREFYCVDPACDCRRVQFQVHSLPSNEFVAAIGHAFTAKQARREGLSQTFLDPLHPNAPGAEVLLQAVEGLLRTDTSWHRRLENHYALVKGSLKPPQSLKVGANEPCPCGSGKKYKKCCRR